MTAVVHRPDRARTEGLLRAALDAKARTVGQDSLRRAAPPSAVPRPRVRMRATAAAVMGLAAAVACVLLAVSAAQREDGCPVPLTSPTHSPTAPEQRRGEPFPRRCRTPRRHGDGTGPERRAAPRGERAGTGRRGTVSRRAQPGVQQNQPSWTPPGRLMSPWANP